MRHPLDEVFDELRTNADVPDLGTLPNSVYAEQVTKLGNIPLPKGVATAFGEEGNKIISVTACYPGINVRTAAYLYTLPDTDKWVVRSYTGPQVLEVDPVRCEGLITLLRTGQAMHGKVPVHLEKQD
jgi:hypothetical protein